MPAIKDSYNQRAEVVKMRDAAKDTMRQQLRGFAQDFTALDAAYVHAGVRARILVEEDNIDVPSLSSLVIKAFISTTDPIEGMEYTSRGFTFKVSGATRPVDTDNVFSIEPEFRIDYRDSIDRLTPTSSTGLSYGSLQQQVADFITRIERAVGGLSDAQVKAVAAILRAPAQAGPVAEPPKPPRLMPFGGAIRN